MNPDFYITVDISGKTEKATNFDSYTESLLKEDPDLHFRLKKVFSTENNHIYYCGWQRCFDEAFHAVKSKKNLEETKSDSIQSAADDEWFQKAHQKVLERINQMTKKELKKAFSWPPENKNPDQAWAQNELEKIAEESKSWPEYRKIDAGLTK